MFTLKAKRIINNETRSQSNLKILGAACTGIDCDEGWESGLTRR